MMTRTRHEPEYWSSCCGRLIEYIGYYRCTGCHQRALFGALPSVTADEAARIRAGIAVRKAAEEEVTADGRLF